MTREDAFKWAQSEYPDGRIWCCTRLTGTTYSFRNAQAIYRMRAKEDPSDRTRSLREAWRLRWLMRLKCMFYRSGKNGKSIVVVPFVPKDSPLQYKDHEEVR